MILRNCAGDGFIRQKGCYSYTTAGFDISPLLPVALLQGNFKPPDVWWGVHPSHRGSSVPPWYSYQYYDLSSVCEHGRLIMSKRINCGVKC